MVSNDDFDGKATHLNCFYLHINFEQIYPKPAIVISFVKECNWQKNDQNGLLYSSDFTA